VQVSDGAVQEQPAPKGNEEKKTRTLLPYLVLVIWLSI
jgi:hypothetical protein